MSVRFEDRSCCMFLIDQEPTHDRIAFAHTTLVDVKIVLNFVKTPLALSLCVANTRKQEKPIDIMHAAGSEGRRVAHGTSQMDQSRSSICRSCEKNTLNCCWGWGFLAHITDRKMY
jgi:hypothetical protein